MPWPRDPLPLGGSRGNPLVHKICVPAATRQTKATENGRNFEILCNRPDRIGSFENGVVLYSTKGRRLYVHGNVCWLARMVACTRR